jgi:signal transduction histidine kinase
MVLAAALNSFLTRQVLRPLSRMSETARRIAEGHYRSRVPVKSCDEVGRLATAFNQMAQSLERIERLRRDMVSNVAHELRTPLTNIRGYLEALQDGILPPSRETHTLLLEETMRLVRLVEDLLLLARADAARTTLALAEVDLAQLIARVLKRFHLMLAEKKITVVTELDQLENLVFADPHKLDQVIENLLRNGWQYTPEGGRISIHAERSAAGVKISVVNSGPGIAPEDLPFVFERFYRGEKSRSRELGGTGIGLAIVKELVESHGGEVGVASSPEATRFWFTLPGRS